MSAIPSFNPSIINIDSVGEINIKDYSYGDNRFKTYGKLNFLNEKTKIVEDYILVPTLSSWCPIL